MADLLEFPASQLARAAADIADYLASLKVHLFQSIIDIQPTTPLATFTAAEATFTGYALGTVTWLDPSIADDGTVEVIGQLTEWRPTGTTITNVIYGVYCVAAVGGALLFAGNLDGAPIPMGAETDSLIVTIRYRPASQSLTVTVS